MALEMLNPAGQADPQGAPPEAAPVGQPPVDPIQVSMEEAKKNRQMLDASIERMRGALQQRTKLPFDPMLMRVAAEAGKPTKTGSFFESLGNIAGGTLEEGENERKRKLETEGKLYELELKRYEAQRKEIGRRALDAALNGEPGAAGGAGGVGGAGPGKHITLQRISQLSNIEPELGKFLKELGEYDLKFYKETKDGIYDIRNPGQPLIRFDQPATETTLPFIGKVNVPPSVVKGAYAIRDEAKLKGWTVDKYKQELAKYYVAEGIGGELIDNVGNITLGGPKPPDAAPAAPGAPVTGAAVAPAGGAPSTDGPRLLNPRDVKRREDFNAGDTAESVKARADVGADLEKNRKLAEIIKPLAQRSINFANSKDGQAVLGQIAGSPNLAQRFADLISQGVNTPTGSISAPAIGEFMTLLNAPEGQINAYQGIVQNAAEFAVQFAKLFSGQGAISDTERTMINRLPPSIRDTPVVYSFKANMLQARTVLDTKRAEAYKQWRNKPDNKEKSGNDYFDSPEDKRLIANYDKWTDHTWHNFFGEPLIPRGQSGKPGQKVGNLESQVR